MECFVSSVVQKTKFVIREFAIITLALLLSIVVPCLYILLTPVLLCRLIISKISKYVRKDLGKILTTRSTVLAVDLLSENPKANIVLTVKIAGEISIQELRSEVTKKVIQANTLEGMLKYPELRQTPIEWMGFLFWKNVRFEIENHVFHYRNKDHGDNCVYAEQELETISAKLITEPFPPHRSPWEVLLFDNCINYADPNEIFTVIILKVHHCITDGFSLLKLFSVLTSGFDIVKPVSQVGSIVNRAIFLTTFIFRAPYELAQCIISSHDTNEWRVTNPPGKNLSEELRIVVVKKISMQTLYEIRSIHSVGLTAVILAAYTGAIRNTMVAWNQQLPKKLHCFLPIPMPGHPDEKLRNFATLVVINLPVGEPDSKKRLKITQERLMQLKSSTLPITSFYLMPLIGSVFYSMAKAFTKNVFGTATASCMPGPAKIISFLDCEIQDSYLGVGPIPGTAAMFTSITYGGSLHVKIILNAHIVPTNESLEKLENFIHEEIKTLATHKDNV